MKTGFALFSQDAELIADALRLAAQVNVEIRIQDNFSSNLSTEYLIADLRALVEHPQLSPDLIISHHLNDATWRFAARYPATQVIELPNAEQWFQNWLSNQRITKSKVISFKSVVAGAGSSVLAAAVSYTAAKKLNVVLIDLDNQRSSLSLLTTIDINNSVTWEQLANLSGLPAGSALYSGLPRLDNLRLLTFANSANALNMQLIESVIALLQEQAQLVIVDEGIHTLTNSHGFAKYYLGSGTLSGLANLKRVAASDNRIVRLIPKTGITKSDATDFLDSPTLLCFESDPRLQLDISDGLVPGERRKSALQKLANQVLENNNA
jgi:hypothetical protein